MPSDNKTIIKELNFEVKPTRCKKCSGELQYMGHGEYQCKTCNEMEYDDFGKVYHYLEEHGPTPAVLISEGTGVPVDKINTLLREGRIEIPEGSDVYIHCESCGTEIRFGRFCPACATKLAKSLQSAFVAGDVPRNKGKSEGSMHFLGKNRRDL